MSRTDANVLLELNPSNMQVIEQTNYTAALPGLKVNLMPNKYNVSIYTYYM